MMTTKPLARMRSINRYGRLPKVQRVERCFSGAGRRGSGLAFSRYGDSLTLEVYATLVLAHRGPAWTSAGQRGPLRAQALNQRESARIRPKQSEAPAGRASWGGYETRAMAGSFRGKVTDEPPLYVLRVGRKRNLRGAHSRGAPTAHRASIRGEPLGRATPSAVHPGDHSEGAHRRRPQCPPRGMSEGRTPAMRCAMPLARWRPMPCAGSMGPRARHSPQWPVSDARRPIYGRPNGGGARAAARSGATGRGRAVAPVARIPRGMGARHGRRPNDAIGGRVRWRNTARQMASQRESARANLDLKCSTLHRSRWLIRGASESRHSGPAHAMRRPVGSQKEPKIPMIRISPRSLPSRSLPSRSAAFRGLEPAYSRAFPRPRAWVISAFALPKRCRCAGAREDGSDNTQPALHFSCGGASVSRDAIAAGAAAGVAADHREGSRYIQRVGRNLFGALWSRRPLRRPREDGYRQPANRRTDPATRPGRLPRSWAAVAPALADLAERPPLDLPGIDSTGGHIRGRPICELPHISPARPLLRGAASVGAPPTRGRRAHNQNRLHLVASPVKRLLAVCVSAPGEHAPSGVWPLVAVTAGPRRYTPFPSGTERLTRTRRCYRSASHALHRAPRAVG